MTKQKKKYWLFFSELLLIYFEIEPLCFLGVIMILKLQMNKQQNIFCFSLSCYTYLLWNWTTLCSLSWTKTNNDKLEQKPFFLVWPKLKWQKMPYGMCYSHFGNGFCNSSINIQIWTPLLKWGVCITWGPDHFANGYFLEISAIVIIKQIASGDPAFCFSGCHNDFEIADE